MAVLKKIKTLQTLDEIVAIATAAAGSLPGFFLSKNLTYLKVVLQARQAEGKIEITKPELELVQQHMQEIVLQALAH